MVSKSTLLNDIHTLVYNALTDSSTGMTDSESPARERTNFIFILPSDETMSSRNFVSYPIILMDSPEANFDPYHFTTDSSKPSVFFKIVADSQSKLKTITDNLKSFMNGKKSTWDSNGLHVMRVYDTRAGSENRLNKICHIRHVVFAWDWLE